MGNEFSHGDVISALKMYFPKRFNALTGANLEFGNERHTRKGTGDNELLVVEIECIASFGGTARGVRVPITFIENKAEEMEVKVGKNTVYKVKQMEGTRKALIKSLTQAIKTYLQSP